MLQAMAGDPGPPPAPAQTRFSADGFWWWDGSEWKPALSQDRLWRWNGKAWEPARLTAVPAPGRGPGAGAAIGITVAIFIGILVLVSVVVVVILYTMGNQIANVFSNVVAALGTPSP
jgi:hypothetical protein